MPARSSTSSSEQIDSSGKNYGRPARWTLREGELSDASVPTPKRVSSISPRRSDSMRNCSCTCTNYAISCADETRLLVDGSAFFAALGKRIEEARHHVHIEFYIWQDDARANEMLDHLVAAARRGVEVRLLLDPIGCFGLRRSHFARLVEAGGKFACFRSAHPLSNQWTFTLLNHRKLQIIDCAHCFVGGMNMGREYAGEDPAIGPWRDIQMIFADDWFFATQEKLLAPRYYP